MDPKSSTVHSKANKASQYRAMVSIKGLTKIEEYGSIEKDLSVGPNNLLRAEEHENRDYLPSVLFNA